MVHRRTIAFLLVNLLTSLAAFASFGAVPPTGQAVTLAWLPGPASTIAGYRLYYGGSSRTYTNMLDAGASTILTVPDLAAGVTYFFAVTAYDIVGLESPFSSEINYTVPAFAKLIAQVLTPGQIVLSGNGPVGYAYEIQASQDLVSWSAVGNIIMDMSGRFQFTDGAEATAQRAYYRLRQTSP